MVNNYKSIPEAVAAWKTDKGWEFSRWYFNRIGQACVCFDGKRYFIITHPDCVNYRKKLGEFVKDLFIS